MADEIAKRRNQRSSTEAVAGCEDPENWASVGMALQKLGGHLVETGRGSRHITSDEFTAEFAVLLPLVAGIIDDLTTLKIGMKAKIIELNGGIKP